MLERKRQKNNFHYYCMNNYYLLKKSQFQSNLDLPYYFFFPKLLGYKDYSFIWCRKKRIQKAFCLIKSSILTPFKSLIELTAVDCPFSQLRYTLVYILRNIKTNSKLILKTSIGGKTMVKTVSHLFSSAFWLEREVWDLFGIYFQNHTDLRRILTDYGFQGHPLRKDFPLTGFTETRFDELKKKVIHEEVQLVQEFRLFEYQLSWK